MLPLAGLLTMALAASPGDAVFQGKYFSGRGDVEYLQLLDISRRMFEPDPEFQNLAMLYTPKWNGLVEGPTWNAWWIQNSYGPTYCALPFWFEPYTTFIQHSQDLWFDQMGDGQRKGVHDWVAPDGCLCDAASPGWIVYKQGDGRIDIHDWGMEFTAAGTVLQAELLLVSRDRTAIDKYLPKLERCVNFIETRRDPKNNLFLAGPAGNLLAPSYAGYKQPDGSYGMAYLSGLSITYIAALDRLIELEKMAGRSEQVALYTKRRDLARQGLDALTTDEGYFIKSLDPDGTRHGVYGAEKHGYFEAVCNHDAICFGVTDQAQSEKIYAKIASIPGLRPYDFIITNYPALDDMYTEQTSIWKFGHWVNGGAWSTCEARMIMAYYRLGKHEDARRSMKKMLDYARRFRMDNPLIDFGNDVYQPKVPINCVYDNWGVPAAMIRGLLEYTYTAEGLKIIPQIPAGITELRQDFPIRFGDRRLYLQVAGAGPIRSVEINGQSHDLFDDESVFLPDDKNTPAQANILIARGDPPDACNEDVDEACSIPSVDQATRRRPSLLSVAELEQFEQLASGNGLPVRIGADSDGKSRFIGEIKRARIHSCALTPEQIERLASAPDAQVKTDALVGDWYADDRADGQIGDHASGKLPATVQGTIAPAESSHGSSMRFDGSGFLEVADDTRLNLPGAFTLDARICPGQLPAGGVRIIDKCPVGTGDGYTFDTYPGNSLRLITPLGTVGYAAKLEPGKWVHVAATLQAGEAVRLYVDGKQVASAPARAAGTVDLKRINRFYDRLLQLGRADSYEAQHARLVLDCARAALQRRQMQQEGKLAPLADPQSQSAADRSYIETVVRLAEGLQRVMEAEH